MAMYKCDTCGERNIEHYHGSVPSECYGCSKEKYDIQIQQEIKELENNPVKPGTEMRPCAACGTPCYRGHYTYQHVSQSICKDCYEAVVKFAEIHNTIEHLKGRYNELKVNRVEGPNFTIHSFETWPGYK